MKSDDTGKSGSSTVYHFVVMVCVLCSFRSHLFPREVVVLEKVLSQSAS
jgi:hypothetical protein